MANDGVGWRDGRALGAKSKAQTVPIDTGKPTKSSLTMDIAFSVVFIALEAMSWTVWGVETLLFGWRTPRETRGKRKRVVIVGASFAGLTAKRHLMGYGKHLFEVVLIDEKSYFEYVVGVLRAYVDPGHYRKLAKQIYHRDCEFIQGRVTKVWNSEVVVQTSDEEKSEVRVNFDFLILATGSSYAGSVKPSTELTITHRMNRLSQEHEKLALASSVIIVGAGLVGVELAAEIVERWGSAKTVTMVDVSSTVCPKCPQKSISYVTKWLENRGVELVLGKAVAGSFPDGLEITSESCTLEDGTVLEADIVYNCSGVKPNTTMLSDEEVDFVRGGFVKVNDFLQSERRGNMFIVGDAMFHERSFATSLNANYAEASAVHAAENIVRLGNKLPMLKFPEDSFHVDEFPLVSCISLGPYDGSLVFGDIFVINGKLAALMKYLLEKSKIMELAGDRAMVLLWDFGNWMTYTLIRVFSRSKI